MTLEEWIVAVLTEAAAEAERVTAVTLQNHGVAIGAGTLLAYLRDALDQARAHPPADQGYQFTKAELASLHDGAGDGELDRIRQDEAIADYLRG